MGKRRDPRYKHYYAGFRGETTEREALPASFKQREAVRKMLDEVKAERALRKAAGDVWDT